MERIFWLKQYRKKLVKKGTLWRLTSAVCVAVGFPVSLITHVAVLNSLLLCAGEPKL